MGSLGWGGTDPLEITSLHHTRHPAEFGRSRSNGASAMEIHLIILNPLASRLSRSLRVAGTRRSVAYDFLLTFHSNCGPTSYRFRDKQRFLSKSQHQTAFRNQKLQWWGYQAEKKSLTISLPVWIQYTSVTDTGRQQIPPALTHIRIPSRGKNIFTMALYNGHQNPT